MMADTLPPGVRRLPLALPQFDGRSDVFGSELLPSRGVAEESADLPRALAFSRWDALLDEDEAEASGAFAGRGSAIRGRAAETLDDVSDAALLAWGDDDEEDDAQVLAGLQRDDEDEHSGRVDSVFEAADDGGSAPWGWPTEDRPRAGAKG